MFNIFRPAVGPASLSRRNNYKSHDVIQALQAMFNGKCYLCEQSPLSDPEVEHFVPHGDDPALMYGWSNLYYACRRCNGIKSNKHRNLLDCTDPNIDVFSEVIHYAGNAAVGEVEIRASSSNPSVQTVNTVNLLKKCFNEESTGLKAVSKESLLERLLEDYNEFMVHRNFLVNRRSTLNDIQNAKENLKVMCTIEYPFSVFWKWHILKDPTILRKHPQIRTELQF